MYEHVDRTFAQKPPFMSFDVWKALLDRIIEYSSELPPGYRATLVFHGGEPTLLGPQNLASFAACAINRLGPTLRELAIQTNAILLSKDMLDILTEFHIRVGVSLDGPPEIHDALRVYQSGAGSYEKTAASLRQMIRLGLRPSVLSVIHLGVSGLKVYRHLRSLGVKSMDFLLPDFSHDTLNGVKFSSDTPVADYLIPIFDDWMNEDDPDISIRVFEKIAGRVLSNKPDFSPFCRHPQNYLVIDTDGSVHLDDVLKVCAKNLSDSGLNVLQNKLNDWHKARPLFGKALRNELPLCRKCRDCSEVQVCDGWFLPHRYSTKRGFDNPAVWCRDLLKLIQHIRLRIDHEFARCA